jgi:hypothetical protein
MAQVKEHLSRKFKALSSNPNTTKRKQEGWILCTTTTMSLQKESISLEAKGAQQLNLKCCCKNAK